MEPDRPLGGRSPVRLLEWRELADGRIAVLRPKFGAGRLGRWLSARLERPYCSVKLDDYGSFVWRQCDGRRTVDEIAEALESRAEAPAANLRERLRWFVQRLEREGLIGWNEGSAAN